MKNTVAVLVEDKRAPHEGPFEHWTFSFKIAKKTSKNVYNQEEKFSNWLKICLNKINADKKVFFLLEYSEVCYYIFFKKKFEHTL